MLLLLLIPALGGGSAPISEPAIVATMAFDLRVQTELMVKSPTTTTITMNHKLQ